VTTEETTLTDDVREEVSSDTVEQAEDQPRKLRRLKLYLARAKHPVRGRAFPILLILAVTTAASPAAGLYYFQYRPDRATNLAVAKSAVSAATDGTVAILSYSPDTLDRDFSSAKSRLTGDFLSYYSDFTQQIVAPAAKQKSVKATATVRRAAVSELRPESATVLVFVNLTTASVDRPQPTFNESSVVVTLARVNGTWLISKFEPV
jgi:Mce-associated membrane protein